MLKILSGKLSVGSLCKCAFALSCLSFANCSADSEYYRRSDNGSHYHSRSSYPHADSYSRNRYYSPLDSQYLIPVLRQPDMNPHFQLYPEIIVTPFDRSTSSFSIYLSDRPESQVTLELKVENLPKDAITITTATITPDNWQKPLVIKVQGWESQKDKDKLPRIYISPAKSNDPNFNGYEPKDVIIDPS